MVHKTIATALLVCALCALVVAQNPRGSLRGAVQDATGARIAFAKIVVRSADASLRRESQSEDRGEFRINDLPAGDYRVAVNAKGFREAQADISVEVSSVREVAVTLEPVAAPETVNVRSQTSSVTTQPIDPVSVVHQGVISSQDLKSLPLASRSFANIAYLAPGTMPVEPSDPTKARITAVSTGGSSGL
ncbi:MAG TPA: carboxypeptidase-like regulatory domain-containing protein, partial [Candidatus Sulfotelmatobacter sp.]|nr:carboxypeptidase-like regulatory domain-containing protein [Candidatus Sulfotelmatobacter sp.]